MRPVRAAFLTPTLLMGGAERWLLSLARRCDRRRIQWTGTALTDRASFSPVLCRELSSYMPVYAGPHAGGGTAKPSVVRCRSARHALAAAVAEADVLLTWGTPRLAELLSGLPASKRHSHQIGGRLAAILVSHGGGEWAARAVQSSESGATHLVAVSEPALTAFCPAARGRAVILHNGVDVERCTPTVARSQSRSGWGFGDRHVLIGYVGRYSWEKNPLAAARAAAGLGGVYRAV
jgi:glycosyltransferase involved in cell wall biosynthesis